MRQFMIILFLVTLTYTLFAATAGFNEPALSYLCGFISGGVCWKLAHIQSVQK